MKVIFASSNLPGALVIRAFTSCHWHHCGIVYNENSVIEASALHGVRMVSLESFKERGDWSIVEIPILKEALATGFLINQLGKPYDWAGAVSLPFRKNWQDDSKWYCSELVAKTFMFGCSPIVRESLKSITPRDIWVQNYPVIARA